ncbi:MAG: hypothetical protein AAGF11_18575 [Myxococcota bacterium]
MNTSKTHRSLLIGAVVGATTWAVASTALAAPPCNVTLFDDDISLPGTLRYCVDQVNQGITNEIFIQTFHWYSPNSPLVFERSARVVGYGRIVMPGDEFVGDSLFVVGTQCPGAGCQGFADVEIEGLELGAVGAGGIRGIDVLDHHSLRLENAQLYDFSKPGSSGGCIRAGQESSLTIDGGTIGGCSADDGGAVFSEATSTSITGTTFTGNTAGWNGGAIAIGTANFFNRTLWVADATFEQNGGNWGGAIKATGGYIEVDVTGSSFLSNTAVQRGGALYGKGTFDTCLFQENTSGFRGGGLDLVEDGTVLDSTFWGNQAVQGGGVHFIPAGTYSLDLEGSTLAYNMVAGDGAYGAGLALVGGTAQVLNSTFSENIANDKIQTSYGGGIAVMGAYTELQHVTLADNTATVGGGIYVDTVGELMLASSIVAYSNGNDCELLGGYGTVTSLDTDGTCGVDFPGTDPGLDPLADNGGPTQTRWPHALEGYDVAVCFAPEDQRDLPRGQMDCDMGSVEW